MRAPAPRFTAPPYAYDTYVGDEDNAGGELLAGERIGRPLTRSRGKALLRSLILIMVVFGSGWMLLRDPATWWGRAQWLGANVMALAATVDRKTPPPLERAASAAAPPSAPVDTEPAKTAILDRLPPTLPPPPPEDSVTPPNPPATSMAPPLTTASLPPAATDKPEPLPPPAVDRSDPYQVRAEAVGLHPRLSRVLLARLSEADYRNAAIAIKTALAKTPDNGTFLWPRQRKPGLALFKVHFVPGASADCRRYVVTVTKDGWVTTAFPMEQCGSRAGRPRRQAG